MIMKKSVQNMNRTELIFAIARYAPPSLYHKIILWPTENIRDLFVYYRQDTKVAARPFSIRGIEQRTIVVDEAGFSVKG